MHALAQRHSRAERSSLTGAGGRWFNPEGRPSHVGHVNPILYETPLTRAAWLGSQISEAIPAAPLSRWPGIRAAVVTMTQQLFTIGYEKRSLDEYLELLVASDISLVIDVRETAWSHKPGFSKAAFSQALCAVGIEYCHAKFAGNPKILRRAAGTHLECLRAYQRYLMERPQVVELFDELVAEHLAAGHRVALTCFERHHEDCHRSIVADAWKQRGRRKVVHIAPEGCKRLAIA